MKRLRHRLGRIAGTWLVLQLAAVGSAPVVLCTPAVWGSTASMECTCSHGQGTECPMHHATPARDSNDCSCRSTTGDAGSVIVASLLGETAVLTAPAPAAAPTARPQRLHGALTHPLDLVLVLDSPPPRA